MGNCAPARPTLPRCNLRYDCICQMFRRGRNRESVQFAPTEGVIPAQSMKDNEIERLKAQKATLESTVVTDQNAIEELTNTVDAQKARLIECNITITNLRRELGQKQDDVSDDNDEIKALRGQLELQQATINALRELLDGIVGARIKDLSITRTTLELLRNHCTGDNSYLIYDNATGNVRLDGIESSSTSKLWSVSHFTEDGQEFVVLAMRVDNCDLYLTRDSSESVRMVEVLTPESKWAVVGHGSGVLFCQTMGLSEPKRLHLGGAPLADPGDREAGTIYLHENKLNWETWSRIELRSLK